MTIVNQNNDDTQFVTFLKIPVGNGHCILGLSASALFTLHGPQAAGIKEKKGGKLLYALYRAGAVLQDLPSGEPAVQRFDAKTGNRTHLSHYRKGELQDPASGEPAVQGFDAKTGNRVSLAHYQQGKCQDPASGVPAVQVFNAKTGIRTALVHYRQNKHQDPPSGEPAVQRFDAKTGLMLYARSSRTGEFTEEQLEQLNRTKKGITPPLPKALEQYKLG